MFNFLKSKKPRELTLLESNLAESTRKLKVLENQLQESVSTVEKLHSERDALQSEMSATKMEVETLKKQRSDEHDRYERTKISTIILKNNHIRELETHIVTLVKLYSKATEMTEEEIYKFIPDYRRFQLRDEDEIKIEAQINPPIESNAKVAVDPNVVDGVSLDKDNREFFYAAESIRKGEPLIYLTGKAGTGKSTFLKYLRQSENKNIVILAPTGVAAMNVGGQTIHSFFRLPLSVFIPNDSRFRETVPEDDEDKRTIYNNFPYNRLKINIIQQLDILVIDEVSMVRCDILDAIDRLLRYFRKSNKPFGGVQMVLIGDAFQLAPVANDDEWTILKEYYDTPYFFSARVLDGAEMEYIELKKIYRQSDVNFINLLNKVRTADVTDADIDLLNSRLDSQFKAPEGEEYIILTTHNQFVKNYNKAKLDEIPTDVTSYEAEVGGNFPEKLMPTEKTLALKVGAQVMFVKNDTGEPREYYNGKIGTIKELTDNIVTVVSNGVEIEVSPAKWENNAYTWDRDKSKINTEQKGIFCQFPLKLAWAITVHKSQGLGFDKVIADLSDAFTPGQVYVALSRCTSFEGLRLISPIPKHAIQTDPHVVNFSKTETLIDF
jgi:ATP-dependent exoDNAse (exonuclease V) alpha subunit/outer membrane murein-binding lipoprotein Lpp